MQHCLHIQLTRHHTMHEINVLEAELLLPSKFLYGGRLQLARAT